MIVGVLQCGLLAVNTWSDDVDARIDATTGLQMSQPVPVPYCAISPENVRVSVARTISNSSARDCVKCSHSAFDSSTPDAASSAFTVGRHPPHVVPAPVQFFTEARSHAPSEIAAQISPLVTALHEHTCASSGSAPAPGFSPAGEISAAGSPGSSRPTSGRSDPYALASPTRMPPSRVRASSETTSLA